VNISKLAMHQTFEKGIEDARTPIIYISDGVNTQRLEPKPFEKFLPTLKPGTVVRSTSADAVNILLKELAERDVSTVYAHWHATKIEKGLDAEVIVQRYAQLPDAIFRPIVYREDLARLRKVVSLRNALQQLMGDAERRFQQAARHDGITGDSTAMKKAMKEDGLIGPALEELDMLGAGFKMTLPGEERALAFDTIVTKLAKDIPECKLFASVAKMEAMIIPARFVSVVRNIERFDDLYSLWHYLGQHVVNGRMPKRQKGTSMDWNPKGRVVMHMLGLAVIKNRKNPWRAKFDEFRAFEIEHHEEKHLGRGEPVCKTIDGHCTNLAAHKVSKEIVKRYFLKATNERFVPGHNPLTSGKAKAKGASA
jgi:hypothetical protein